MRKLLTGLFLFGCIHASLAQSAIKGKVVDTLEKKNLENAVVSLLRKSDSTLFKFIRTDKNGEFSISNAKPGKYILLVTYPKFVDYVDEMELSGTDKNLGILPLIQKSALLEEVMVRQNIAIRMKGDTIEYKADSFKVQEGASVKELLKKLPGLQVDKDGQITAQGQKVGKVLVDGEEFFSDDPAVVIENLRADAIDKVQSYDKKSDQAEFTGVDDGSKTKTLNLVLKEDKKKGLLGKIVVAGGTTERYSEEAMLNYFKGKKKVSVYGIASNTGKTGLGWEDSDKFGSGNGFGDGEIEMGAGFIMITGGGDNDFSDWSNTYNGEGLPVTLKAGAHVSNKWNADKQNANANYSIKNVKVNGEGNSLTKYILPDSAYYSRENHTSNSRQTDQLFNGMYDVKLDSTSSLLFKMNGKISNSSTGSATDTRSEDEDLQPVNRNVRTNTANTDSKIFLGSALWRQKFKKKGRTISLSASLKNTDKNSNGFLYSETDYFDRSGSVFRRDSIDQYKTSSTNSQTVNSKLVYTEPLGKKALLEFNYTFSNTSSVSDRKSFDKKAGKYESLNNLYSNNYELGFLSNSTGLKYQYNGKKLVANIGSNVGISNQVQKDSMGRELRHYRYTNLFPNSRITYKFSAQRSLNLNYTGSPQPPAIDQIQPIAENTNPLFITIGNPSLKQAFNHNLSLFYNDYKVLTGRSIWVNASISPVQNAISTNQVVDSGVTTQQFVNTRGNYNYWFYGSYGFKLKKLDLQVGLNLNTNGSRHINFVNGLENTTDQSANGLGIYAYKYKENKYDFGLNARSRYNRFVSSITKEKNNFWSHELNTNINVFVTKKFQVGTELNASLSQKTDAFTSNNNIAIWNADLSYKVFKKNNGIIKFEVQDILKQRRGYQRNFSSNYIYEKNYNTLGRYGLLSFIWNFTKNPEPAK